jgi:hypothetical protein
MFDKITKNFLKKISKEIKKAENQKIIQEDIIRPIMKNITTKIYPWVNLLFFMYSLILILIISILVLVLINRKTI